MGEQMGVLSNGGAQREGSVGPTTIPAPQGLAGPPTDSYPERHVGPSGSRVEVAPGTTDPGEKVNKENKRMGTRRKGGGKESRKGTMSPGGMPVPIGPTVLSQRPRGAHPAAPVAGLWAFSQGPGLVPQSPGCPALAQDVHPKAGARQLAVPKPEPTPRTPAMTRRSLEGESA